MSLDPRAIAVQGIGFGPRLTALQGFYEVVAEDVLAPMGVGADARSRIARRDPESDTFVPADVLALQRLAEDEILLVMIARAVTSGVLNQWH